MEWFHKWLTRFLQRKEFSRFFQPDCYSAQTAKLLNRREPIREQLLRLYRKRALTLLAGFALVILVTLSCLFGTSEKMLKGERSLERGTEDAKAELKVKMEGELQKEKEVVVSLPIRKLAVSEKKELSITVNEYLRRTLTGKNESLEKVKTNLYLPEEIQEYDVSLEWQTDERYINLAGRLKKKKIPEDGVRTTLTVTASRLNWKEDFMFDVFICGGLLTKEEKLIEQVKEDIKKSEKAQATKKRIELPEKSGGVRLSYSEQEKKKDFMPVFVVLGGILFLPILWREQQKRLRGERENQLMLDYPEFVNRIMLLLGAGLTVRSAIERLSHEYEENRPTQPKYLYEELWVTCWEMENGTTEAKALEDFGNRCQMLPYLRFSTIVVKNWRKGSAGILKLLETDAKESFERRKEIVKRMGEEAGTKLLFPMMLMLLLVMAIIMVPAFMTM